MKKLVTMVLAAVMAFSAAAQTAGLNYKPVESAKEFSVDYAKFSKVKSYKVPAAATEAVDVTKAFKVKENGLEGEIRYSLYVDTGTTPDTYMQDFVIWSTMIIADMTGVDDFESLLSAFSMYDDGDVQAEFNADAGFTMLMAEPESAFAQGYDYLYIDAFAKQGQGIVIRSMLFNDIAFTGIEVAETGEVSIADDAPLVKYFHSFTFKD